MTFKRDDSAPSSPKVNLLKTTKTAKASKLSSAPTKAKGKHAKAKDSKTSVAKTRTTKSSKAAHDPINPANLLAFMVTDWKPSALKPTPIAHAEAFKARRQKVSRAFAGQCVVIATGHEKVRANDTYYRFRPNTECFYLTGNHEPDVVLVLEPKASGGHKHVLYVEPNPGKTDTTFFTDRNKGELWVGPRLGISESKIRFGVDEARSIRDLKADLGKQKAGKIAVLRGVSEHVDALVKPNKTADVELARFVSELRLIKEAIEVKELVDSVNATKQGFEDVIAALSTAKSEREVEGTFNYRARVEGNDVGYGTIAAAGCHACTLHWTHNNGPVKKGELLLLDAGVEGHSLYTADVTRTLPISGKFTAVQREVYELVYRSQRAALKEVKPGNEFMAPYRAAMQILAEGLVKMGVLKCSVQEALDEKNQYHKRYTLHGVSHMLGLDVHDCAKARSENYKYTHFKEGMVLTVEPGLYFQTDDLTVPAKYRGIGVRIEDDVVVTKGGHRNLSEHIPAEISAVEKWMAQVWAGTAHSS
jgi:Xaa-Pro aminopeptidase